MTSGSMRNVFLIAVSGLLLFAAIPFSVASQDHREVGPEAPTQSFYDVDIACDHCDGVVTSNSGQIEKHSYDATVTNTGLRADGYNIVSINSHEWTVSINPSSISLLPSQSEVINISVTVPADVADMSRVTTDLIVQSTSTGCSNCDNVKVTTTVHAPSLLVDDIKLEPSEPEPGQEAKIIVTVRNQGSATSQDAAINVEIDGSTYVGDELVGELAPDEVRTVEVPWTPEDGDHQISAFVSSNYRAGADIGTDISVSIGGPLRSGSVVPVIAIAVMVVIVIVVVIKVRKRRSRT